MKKRKEDKKFLFLKEFVDFFWKQYNNYSKEEKIKALRKIEVVLSKSVKNLKDKKDKIWALKELKRIKVEECNLEDELNFRDLERLKEIFKSLMKTSNEYLEDYNFLEEFKGVLWNSKLKSKDRIQEFKIIKEIYLCLIEEQKTLFKLFKNNKNKSYLNIKKNYAEIIGFFYTYFSAATSYEEKVLILRDYLRIIRTIKTKGFYDELIEQVKDLSHSVMQWCDELYLKNNLESKFFNSKKRKLTTENSKLIKIRNEFIKNIIYYWDKTLKNPDPKKQGYGTHDAIILNVEFLSKNKKKKFFKTNEEFVARIHYKTKKIIKAPMFGIAIYSSDGILITGPNTTFSDKTKNFIRGEGFVYFKIKKLPLLNGKYFFSASIYDYTGRIPLDHHHQQYVFHVVNDFSKFKEKYGLLSLEHEWDYREKKEEKHKKI